MNKYKDTLFNTSTENVLAQGLKAMTLACDSLTLANETLRGEVDALQAEIESLKHRLVVNTPEKE